MSFQSSNGRGEFLVPSTVKRAVIFVISLVAVVTLAFSMLVLPPSAHAQDQAADSNPAALTQDDSDGGVAQTGNQTPNTDGETDSGASDLGATPTSSSKPQAAQQDTQGDKAQKDANKEPAALKSTEKNWADEYIESVKVYRAGADDLLTGPPSKETPLFSGTPVVFQVDWSALGKDQAAPGDILEFELPEWLKLNVKLD